MRKVLARYAIAGLVLVPCLPNDAAACGGLVQSATGNLGSDAQRAFLSVNNGRTELVVQIVVPKGTGSYGVLLPTPSEPMLDATPVASKDLDTLEAGTRPQILQPVTPGGGGGGCAGPNDLAAGGKGGVGGGVQIGQQVEIGPVTAVSLSAQDGTVLSKWLMDNGFVIPAGAQRVVDGYAGPGKWFVAFKRNDSAQGPSSVGIHLTLAGDQRSYALRMSSLGVLQSLAVTVFVSAPAAVGAAAPYSTLTLVDLPKQLLRGGDYKGALREAVKGRSGRAFVAEGLFESQSVLPPGLAKFAAPGSKLTRLSTVLDASELSEDVSFTGPAPATITNEVVAAKTSRSNAFGLSVGVLAAAMLLRRKKKG